MPSVVVDTGVLTNYFSKNKNPLVANFIKEVKNEKIELFILSTTLPEVYFHLCKIYGRDSADTLLKDFLIKVPHQQVNLDEELAFSSGVLKCQHRTKLSYNDCNSIAFCLLSKFPFYTTEKLLRMIPHNTLQRLKIKAFKFD